MRYPNFTPKKTSLPKHPWTVNLPANITPNGKRVRRFFKTKVAADAFAEVHRIRQLNFGRGSTMLTASQLEQATAAFERLPEGVTLAAVVTEYLERRAASSRSVTLSAAWANYLQVKTGISPVYRQAVDTSLRSLKSLADRIVAELTPAIVEEALGGMLLYRRQSTIKHLTAVLNHAVKRDWLAINPMVKVDRIPIVKGETVTLTPAQATALMQSTETKPELILYNAIGLFAGVRPYELERLTWDEIDIVRNEIRVTAAQSKTGKLRRIPIEPNLKAWIDRALALGVKPKGRIAAVKNLRDRLREVKAAAGHGHWVQDVMRHSYASCWLAQFGDINRLTLALGHTSTDMLWRHYHASTSQADAALYWAIVPSVEPTNIVAITG